MPKWVTVHPVYEEGDGRHVLIDDDGTVLAGMGGRFNGRNISHLKDPPKSAGGEKSQKSGQENKGKTGSKPPKLKVGHVLVKQPFSVKEDKGGDFLGENKKLYSKKSVTVKNGQVIGMDPDIASFHKIETEGEPAQGKESKKPEAQSTEAPPPPNPPPPKPSIPEGAALRDKVKAQMDALNLNSLQPPERRNALHEWGSLNARLGDIESLEKAGITDESHPTFQKVMKLRDEAEQRYNDWRDSLSYEDLKDQILSKKWSNDAKRREAWRDYYAQQEASNAKKDEFHKADAAVALANPGTEYDDDVQPLAEPLQAREHDLTSPVSRKERRRTRDTDHGHVTLENAQWHRAPRYHTGEGNYLIGLHPDEAKKLGVPLREKGHAHDSASGILAYDRTGSVRTFDDNGRLRVETTPISKANICEYLGKEIPDNERLGLKPDKLYRLLRDPKELEKAADTFNSLPVLEEHVPTRADAHPRELTVGATMDNARFEAPYLTVGMVIFDGPAIQRIQNGQQRELSCGYAYGRAAAGCLCRDGGSPRTEECPYPGG